MSHEISIPELMAVCVKAAEKACNRIRIIHASGNLHPIEKGDGRDSVTGRRIADLQTEADRQSEAIVFSVLRRHLGDVKIVGEEQSSGGLVLSDDEGNHSRSNSIVGTLESTFDKVKRIVGSQLGSSVRVKIDQLAIFVDPLDGTSQFVHGSLHCVSVLIGVALQGARFAGVIARPFPDTEFPHSFMYGIVGIGSFLDHTPISAIPSQRHSLLIATSPNRSTRLLDEFLEEVPAEVLKVGGAGWKCWLVASRTADCYLYARPGTKKWDVLAGDAIISALGGVVTDACGRPFRYDVDDLSYNNDWGLIASFDKQLHFNSIVPACHRILADESSDERNLQWPHGLSVPTMNRS